MINCWPCKFEWKCQNSISQWKDRLLLCVYVCHSHTFTFQMTMYKITQIYFTIIAVTKWFCPCDYGIISYIFLLYFWHCTNLCVFQSTTYDDLLVKLNLAQKNKMHCDFCFNVRNISLACQHIWVGKNSLITGLFSVVYFLNHNKLLEESKL